MSHLEEGALILPITEAARRTAMEFSNRQPTPQKMDQVLFNTLAVWVVNDYLQLMGITTHLRSGDSWNPVIQLGADVADLVVAEVGRLECRPVAPGATACYIPPEVWCDRLGYVVVEIDGSFRRATLLGFTPTAVTEYYPLAQLQPLESLLAHLHELIEPQSVPTPQSSNKADVNLSQWMQGIFENGWQPVEMVLSYQLGPTSNFRNTSFSNAVNPTLMPSIRQAKLMDLGPHLKDAPVALLVNLQPNSNQERIICIQVHPTGVNAYLPPKLQLIVLDDSDAAVLETQSRRTDEHIQLQFSGQSGDRFSVVLMYEGSQVTEKFVL